MDYKSAEEYMTKAASRGSMLGLSRMSVLCGILNNPEEDLSFIHVAGTNGKGSTSCFISEILFQSGYRVGMYYSPALSGIKDHYRINGNLISDDEYALLVEEISEANNSLFQLTGEEATQFELETALAFCYFKKNNCDVVVLETGLGGLLDATNIVKRKLACVFTSISLDHMAILGDSLTKIAEVKSGIITSDCPVIAFDSSDEVIEVIKRKCRQTGSGLSIVKNATGDYFVNKNIDLSLKGLYQKDNARLAEETALVLCKPLPNINKETIARGLSKAKWPFRYEKICDNPLIILDGAHNADAAKRLKESVVNDFSNRQITLVIGMFKDKEYEKVISTLAPLAYNICCLTTPNNERALDGALIQDIAKRFCDRTYCCDSVRQAAQMSVEEAGKCAESVILAFGSLSYLDLYKTEVLGVLKENG